MNDKGVTIIELVVVLAIFALMIIATASIFISAIQQQKGTLRDQELLNQVDYVIEYMSRTMRMAVNDTNGDCLGPDYAGYDYVLTHFDSSSGFYQGIKFSSSYDGCHEFFLDTDGILKSLRPDDIYNILSPSQFNNFTIKYIRFIINGDKAWSSNPPSSLFQPRVTIALDVLTNTASSPREKIFQTTISRRDLIKLINLIFGS